MPKSIKQLIRRDIETLSAEWIDRQPVLLGDYASTVQTPTPGVFYARQFNGKVIEVHNTANVPPTFDLHVIVGRKKSLPTIWQIIEVRETYLSPAGAGQIGYHHSQHEFPNGDTVWSDRKQILPLTVLVQDAAGFVVLVFGSVVHTATGIHKIATQMVDLSSYVVTVGAKFVAIETDDDGVLSVHDGVAFDAPAIGTDADIPVPASGKYLIAFILLYEGQTELSNNDIRVPFPLGGAARSHGHDATDVTYAPAVLADWNYTLDPGDVDEALDQLAERVTDVEGVTFPDATDVTYTPAVTADWNYTQDPGDVDDALDQLAERLTDVEGSSAVIPTLPGGRLSLTTAVPVTTADVTGATTVYYTPYLHNVIELWTGVDWNAVTFAETSLALGTLTSGLPYDVFGYLSSGALALEMLAWTNGTTRATGISLQDGRYCKTGDKTRLYLGSFYTTSTTQTEDSEAKRFLFNMCNRRRRSLKVENSSSHNYNVATVRAFNNSQANSDFEYFIGLVEDAVEIMLTGQGSRISTDGNPRISIGVNSTTTELGLYGWAITVVGRVRGGSSAAIIPTLGYSFICILEFSSVGTAPGATFEAASMNGIVWA